MLLVVLVVIAITIYIIFYVIYPGAGSADGLPTLTPLNVKKDIIMPDVTQKTILGSGGSTVMGYIKLLNGDRTSTYKNGTTQMIPIIQVMHNWYLEISPTSNDHSTVRLRVTTSHQGSTTDEMIDLPPIPKQKWVFIAILREGRRFDIIYDDAIVASQRLLHYPVVVSSPLSVGNKGLDGSIIHVITNGTRMNPREVERERLAHIDSNHTVIEDNKINMSLPAIRLLADCPSGLPCDPITKPPNNRLFAWDSPFA
jgi:hypothetical protein